MTSKKLVIVGDSGFAQIAREYFDTDSEYTVVAHTVESQFLERREFDGLPVVPFEEVQDHFPPDDHGFHVALTYGQLNRVRARLIDEAKSKGYAPVSYVSSKAFCGRTVQLGEHVFIFEDNTIQPFVTIGKNTVLWSGNHIGHHSHIGENCFVSSHVVISGFCNIGANTFLGVNATLADGVSVAEDNWIGPSVTLSKSTEAGQLYNVEPPAASRVSTYRFFKIKN